MGGCLPSMVLWPAQCCAHGYKYTAMKHDVSKGVSFSNSTYICMPHGGTDANGKARYPLSLKNSVERIHQVTLAPRMHK